MLAIEEDCSVLGVRAIRQDCAQAQIWDFSKPSLLMRSKKIGIRRLCKKFKIKACAISKNAEYLPYVKF